MPASANIRLTGSTVRSVGPYLNPLTLPRTQDTK